MTLRKSTVDEIRERFDADVARFSNLETGQSATIDAPLAMQLVVEAAAVGTPGAKRVLDVGCGAGNYTLKLLERLPNLEVTLIDLSRPMLLKAEERITAQTGGAVKMMQGDIREIVLGDQQFDIILAAAVLHHLRDETQWRSVFEKLYQALSPGGSCWIFDLIDHDCPAIRTMMVRRYGEYLSALKDEAYRDHVFAYIEQEDSPRSLNFQLDLLREVGFSSVEVLHKNACFAAFGGIR